ncbi:hypothetical protein HPP92_011752 [Vanilla planifolia]|uniref:Uncharacterized protein n=1 Tax=Vanilla planifolia TaxID=51239 RepID=A0A835UYR0_VANPL|nr:hypothetical protein HPP92_011752 [Vanilla planifolia]
MFPNSITLVLAGSWKRSPGERRMNNIVATITGPQSVISPRSNVTEEKTEGKEGKKRKTGWKGERVKEMAFGSRTVRKVLLNAESLLGLLNSGFLLCFLAVDSFLKLMQGDVAMNTYGVGTLSVKA